MSNTVNINRGIRAYVACTIRTYVGAAFSASAVINLEVLSHMISIDTVQYSRERGYIRTVLTYHI